MTFFFFFTIKANFLTYSLYMLYIECWDDEPDNRPTMKQVVVKLKSMIATSASNQIERDRKGNHESKPLSSREPILFQKNLRVNVDEMVDLIFREENDGVGTEVRHQHHLDFFDDQNITLQEMFSWLLGNQNDSNSIFLLGYFNYYGIETTKDKKKSI